MLFSRGRAKKSRLPLLFIVAAFPLVARFVQAQEGDPPPASNLFVAADVPGWEDPLESAGATVLRSRPVWVNFDLLNALDPEALGPDQTPLIQFNLFDDSSVAVLFDQAKPRWPSDFIEVPLEAIGYTWHGLIVGEEQGHVVMITEEPDMCAANIHVAGVGSFQLRRLGDGLHVVRELDRSAPWVCGMEADGAAPMQGSAGESQGAGGAQGSSCDDGSTIDLIVLYTPAAKQDAGGDKNIKTEIDLAIEDANAFYSNSEIGTRLRLLYKAEIEYEEFGFGAYSLCRLVFPWDEHMDEVHALRNALRADLVSLVISFDGSAGYRMTQKSPFFEYSAFNVLDWGQNELSILLAHELGHNMGCAHDRFTDFCTGCPDCGGYCDVCSPGVFPHSFGYTFTLGENDYSTIMAAGGLGSYIDHFSNPNVEYCISLTDCAPTGVDASSPDCDSADNAATINVTRYTVAQFRTSDDTTDTTTMASLDFFAGQAQGGDSFSPSISSSGQFVAFASDATNLAQPDTNAATDVFVYNGESGLVSVVSFNAETGELGNGDSVAPSVSGNGHFVAFATDATNLVPGLTDNNLARDIYVFDLFEPPHSSCDPADGVRMARISVDSSGTQADGDSDAPSSSFDGRFIAFQSNATNLVGPGGDMNGLTDIFVRDRNGDGDENFDEPDDVSTTRVSVAPGGAEPDGPSLAPSISADGRYVAFESDATNLLGPGNDTNGLRDIFIHDRATGQTIRVSLSSNGTEADGSSYASSISADGRYVTFESDATNLLGPGGDANGARDIFVRDRDTDGNGTFDEPGGVATFRVSVSTGGDEADGPSFSPCISPNGRFVDFHSDATNLLGVGGDTNSNSDVFVHDLEAGETVRISISSTGSQATGGGSFSAAITGDGRFIAFASDATNLVQSDQGGFTDVFFRDRGPMHIGDLNGDGVVDETDLDILNQNWGECRCCAADLDGDGKVGILDLLILLANWG